MTPKQYAEHTGRSVQLIGRWCKPGGLIEKACKRADNNRLTINADKADALLEMTLNVSQSREKYKKGNDIDPTGGNIGSYSDALTADKFYAAANKKLKFEQDSGKLVLKADVEKEAFEIARQVRDAILNISSRVSSILAAVNDENEVEEILTKELTQALEELSDDK